MTSPLRERLRGALRQPARDRPPAQPASVTELPDLSGLGGRWFETSLGPGYVIESVYEPGHEHGALTLHRTLAADLGALAAQGRAPELARCDPRDLLFIDTETTGLGGAGTMVFLAGAARFTGDELRLRQYLLPAPAMEIGILGALADEIAEAGALVSYNGKSFDIPALESRYILSRQRPRLRDLPHLDLLHPNRRLLRGTLSSHRLVHLETQVLGFEREDDCPSAEVPARYLAFQRSGDPTPIRPVLRHNAWDILSLVALTAHLAGACAGDAGPLQAARAAEYAGDLEAAAARYEAAIAERGRRANRLEAIERAAECYRRLGRHADAARLWRSFLSEPRARRLRPYVELAKIAEHRDRDPEAALRLVDDAIALTERGIVRAGRPGSGLDLAALRHRRERLARKASRSQEAR